MSENPERKKSKNVHRSLAAGAAMLAGISAAESGEMKTHGQLSIEQMGIQGVEAVIEADTVPLKEQIQFLETVLKPGGAYFRELGSIRLSVQRLSKIYKITNAVSARLTTAYEQNNDDPDVREYFRDVETLRNTTTQLRVAKPNGNEICNKYLVRDGAEVFEVTAFHCVKDSTYEQRFFHPDGTEIAVRHVPEKDPTPGSGAAHESIPAVNPEAAPDNINGSVITAFSWSPRGEAKVHFSFAMPMPAKRSLVFSPKEMYELGPLGVIDMNVFFKPFGEGMRNPETKKTNAAGSSGGPVFARDYGILGNYSATKVVADNCIHVCYAASFFSGPQVLQQAIAGERAQRALRK